MATALDLLIMIKTRDEASHVLGSVGGTIGKLGLAAAAAGAGIAAGLAVGIKSAGDLQQSVANISTIKPTINTSQVFSQLNEISTRVPQTAKELGDGLYNIFSSIEVSQEQALGLVETFAKGAVGASTDAATFGTAALGVLNAYGKGAEEASHISDVFFNTIKLGVVTGEELAANLGLVTQSAKMAGVDFDSLGGFIAGVTKEGGPAAQNMNNLNNLFLKITTKEATKAFHELGIATADATGNFRPQIDVLADLKAATAGMTEEARTAAVQKIFPDLQARAGAAVIMDQLDFVRAAIEENKASAGSAASAYEKMSETFNSQTKLLSNAFTSMLTTLGAGVLPVLTPIITAFAKGMPDAMAAAGAAIDNVKSHVAGGLQGIADKLAETGAAWAPWAAQAGPAGEAVGSALSGASGAVLALQLLLQGNFGGALDAARDAMKDFGVAADHLRDMFDQLIPQVDRDEIWNNLKDAVKLTGDAFALLWPEIQKTGEHTGTTAESAGNLSGSLKDMSAGVKGVAAAVGPIIQVFIDIGTALDAVNTASMRTSIGIHNFAVELLNTNVNKTASDFQALGAASDALGQTQIALHNSIVSAWSAMTETIGAAMSAIGATVGNGFSALGTAVQSALSAIQGFFSATWNQIPEDIRVDLDVVSGLIVTDLGAWLASIVSGMVDIGIAIQNGWTAVASTVGTAMSNIGTAVQDGWSAITAKTSGDMAENTVTVSTGWDAVLAATTTAWASITEAIGSALATAIAAVSGWVGQVVAAVQSLGAQLGEAGRAAGQAAVDGLVSAISGGVTSVGNAAANLARGSLAAMKAALPGGEPHSPWPAFVELGKTIPQGLIAGLESMHTEVSAAMKNVITSAVGSLKSGGSGGFLTIPQFGSAIKALGFSSDAISAICGPIAAQGISEGLGKSVSLIDVEAIASKIGAYARGKSTFGSKAFQNILSAIGIDSRSASFSEAVDAAMKGIPVAISTPLHYFLAQGFDNATQQFVVGNTGTALKRGAEKMTAAAIEGVAGAATYIIPSLQAAGAAVQTLGDTIAGSFVGVATPAVFDLESAISDLVGSNALWSQLDANASATGRDLATYLGDIAAPGIDLATASLQELQAMSGLTLPDIQMQAEAAGQDIETWLLDVGVPAAQGLADAFQELQDRGVPAMDATGVSLIDLGKSIEASFTSTAPTAIDKFFNLLDKLARDVDKAGDDIGVRMEDIATKVATGIAKATEDGAKQIADAMKSAQDQLNRLGGGLADPNSGTAQQTVLEQQIAAAKALHAQQRSDADALFSHQQDLAKAAAQFDKDLATAQKDVDKARVKERYDELVQNLNTSYSQKVADGARTRALDEADRAFGLIQDAKLVKFKEDAILAARDMEIDAAKVKTAALIATAQDGADQERQVLVKSYRDKLADLRSGLLSQLPGLTGEAAAVVQGVLDQVERESAGVTATITGDLGALAKIVADTLVRQYGISFEKASEIVADHGDTLHRVLGVGGTIPRDLAVSDRAVEDFADTFKLTWPEARRILENAGTVATQVMGAQGEIPIAAKQTIVALGGVGKANKDLIDPLGDSKTALSNLAEDGFGVAQKAAGFLREQFPGFFDAFKAQFPELTTAIDGLIDELARIPTEITTTITTEFAQSDIPEGSNRNAPSSGSSGSSGRTGHDSSAPDLSQAALSSQSNRADLRAQGYQVGSNPDGTFYAEKRASGGPVRGGMPYFVGEHGPELFVPQSAGSISATGMNAGGNIDYDRLANAVARAIQGMPAPRVAVEDVRSLLIRIGQRNAGIVGLA